jgi:hypothetical protein
MKPKLTKPEIAALKEAYEAGAWSGKAGKQIGRKPVSTAPLFSSQPYKHTLPEIQQELCFS